jgi:Tfp pilus assembly protein PilF
MRRRRASRSLARSRFERWIPAFHNNVGLAFDGLGRTQDAVGHYGRAIALKPIYVEAHNNFGATLQAQSIAVNALLARRQQPWPSAILRTP